MMDYEHPFVQEVRANPHDDAPRLIFADYLEEAGDLRGELIRLQVALSHLPPGDLARRELELREQEILAEYADDWLQPLTALGAEGVSARCFQRGLIERVRIALPQFVRHGGELCRQAPALWRVELRGAAGNLESLVQAPLPPQVTSLDLSANKLTAADLRLLALAPWRRQLVQLSLAFNQLANSALASLGDWSALALLDLSVNKLGPADLRALSRTLTAPRLTELRLAMNPLGNEGLAALASSPLAAGLKQLDLAQTQLTAQGLRAALSSPLWSQLVGLSLRGNSLGDQAAPLAEALARAAPQLQQLDLRNTHRVTGSYGYGAAARDQLPQSLIERFGEGLLW